MTIDERPPEVLPPRGNPEPVPAGEPDGSYEAPEPAAAPCFEDGTPYPPTWVESGGRAVPYDVMTKAERDDFVAHGASMMRRRSPSWDMPLWKGLRYDWEVAKRTLKEDLTIGNRVWAVKWHAQQHAEKHPEGVVASAGKKVTEIAAFYGDEELGTKRKAITVAVAAVAIGWTAYASYKFGSAPLPGHLGLGLPHESIDSNAHAVDIIPEVPVSTETIPQPAGNGMDIYLAQHDNPWHAITQQLGGRIDHLPSDQATRVVDALKDYVVLHDLAGRDATQLRPDTHFGIPEAVIRAALEQYGK